MKHLQEMIKLIPRGKLEEATVKQPPDFDTWLRKNKIASEDELYDIIDSSYNQDTYVDNFIDAIKTSQRIKNIAKFDKVKALKTIQDQAAFAVTGKGPIAKKAKDAAAIFAKEVLSYIVANNSKLDEGAAPWKANTVAAMKAEKKAQQTKDPKDYKKAAEAHAKAASDPWHPDAEWHKERAAEWMARAKKMGLKEGRHDDSYWTMSKSEFEQKIKERFGEVKRKNDEHGRWAYFNKDGVQVALSDIDGEGDRTWSIFKTKKVAEGIKESERSTDELLELLTAAYRVCVNNRDAFMNFSGITRVYNLMRDPLLKGDMQEFDKMYDHAASKYPDAFDILMDEIPGGKGLVEGTALSPKTLADYKKAAAEAARELDKQAAELYAKGDVAGAKQLTQQADKRFSGIIKATGKQFDNDTKGIREAQEKKYVMTHANNCPWNYGHDCDCGEKTPTHNSDCGHRYGHDCDCGYNELKKKHDDVE